MLYAKTINILEEDTLKNNDLTYLNLKSIVDLHSHSKLNLHKNPASKGIVNKISITKFIIHHFSI